ncbi:MAG: hypothetical protein IPL61_36665 [Myxococcales bacterium]|nr:hypothetical protein [Myxococcales bacterium]
MKRMRAFLLLSGLAAAVGVTTPGCGDSGATCGTGTTEVDGVCVATPTTCATGTVLMGTTCVPDGTVVCQQGTVFDAPTGTCVIDPAACVDGTTLVDGECIPDDQLLMGAADHVEAAEPNGPGDMNVAGSFATPALDQSTTFYGCVTATEDADGDGNLDADYDTWLVNASGPMVLEVTTDGIGGLSAGFVVVSADAAHPAALDTWQRLGINLTGDTAKREIYLPAAGRYALFVTDARSLFLGQAGAGTADTCYFATVKHVATPAATALTIPSQAGTDAGKVKLYTFTADGAGDILDVTLNGAGPALQPAFVALRGTALHNAPAQASTTPPFDTVGGLDSGDVVTIIVDPEYNYGVTPQAYTIDSFAIDAPGLPTTGGMITVTEQTGAHPAAAYVDLNYRYFDVATAGLVRFALTSSVAVDMTIVRRDLFTPAGAFDTVATIDAFGGAGRTSFDGEFVKFLAPGRYYFVTQNPAATAPGGTYTITATIAAQASSPITLGTEVTGQALVNGNSFHTLDLTNPIWLEFGATAVADFGAANTFGVETYDLAAEGWLRTGAAPTTIPTGNLYPAFAATQPSAPPFAPFGRIVANDTRDYLVRVRPSGIDALGAAPTYSLLVRNRPNVVNLGAQAPGAPTTQMITALDDTTPARFIVLGAAGNNARALVHPLSAAADVRIRRLGANEAVTATFDAAGVGGDETLNATLTAAPGNWVAWTVENLTAGTPTDVTQTTTVIAPRPYVVTTGALAWDDACVGGTTLGTGQDDQLFNAQTLPGAFATFALFGEVVPATFRVGANGWMSWDTGSVSFGAYQNRPIPTATAPNGVLAPFWQDLDSVTLCRKDVATVGAETVTYQWTGNVYQSGPTQRVQFQVVIHANGVLDFIYGPMQLSNCAFDDGDGTGCTVGAENLGGTFGQQIHFNTASVTANTSRTLTPM